MFNVSEDLIFKFPHLLNGARTMLKNFRDKIAVSGVTVLMIGVALLVFTFISAYGFLTQSLTIIASEDLVQTFGEALAPLIASCIRIMYLGVMGWIGSLVTIRGVTIIAHTPQPTTIAVQKRVAAKPKPIPQKAKAEKPEEEAKAPTPTPEPEIVFIPPKEIPQAQPQQQLQEYNSSKQPGSS